MPKNVSTSALDDLKAVVARFPNGISLDEILVELGGGLARRTLQRRLSDLVGKGQILRDRRKRSVRYRLAPNTASGGASVGITVAASAESDLPLSPEGEEIKAYIRQPMQLRRPEGYDIKVLEAYVPNVTWYLPDTLRSQLHTLGRSSVETAPAGTFARDILHRLLIDLSWASARLEGNTYSRLDTEQLIDFGKAAVGKDAMETQMILNHKGAIEYLVNHADSIGVNRETIIALHALLSDGLLLDPMAVGTVRRRAVEISGSVYRPIALPQRLEEVFDSMLTMAAEIDDAFEQAFFLMVHLPYLQPFLDVNKRVSRLAANIPLIRENLSPLSFIDVPQRIYLEAMLGVYELKRVDLLRDVFVWAYARSCQQYVAVRSQLVPPDTFRLRHRAALAEIIRTIIRTGLPATEATVRGHLPASVQIGDQEQFIQLVLEEFKTLHAGNAVRFGVGPFEFEAWARR